MSIYKVEARTTWLGDIPDSWNIVPSWAIFHDRSEKSIETDEQLTPSQHHGVVTQAQYMEKTGNRVVANKSDSVIGKRVSPGNFIIHLRSFQGGLELSRISGKVTNAYTVLSAQPAVDPEFFRHFLKSLPFISGLSSLTDQLRDGQSINFAKFSTMRLPLPPLPTQRAIADYLDRETTEIDAMAAELDELVARLETRLNLAVESEIAKLGDDIPLVKSELLMDIRTGSADTKDADENGDYDFFVRSDTVRRANTWEFDGDAILTAGDGAGVGKVFHRTSGKFMAHQRVYVLNNFTGLNRDYFFHYFRSSFHKIALDGSAKSTVDSVRRSMISDMKVPLPSLGVQIALATKLDEIELETKEMIADAEDLKALLAERRSALITEVVTGRKEVFVS